MDNRYTATIEVLEFFKLTRAGTGTTETMVIEDNFSTYDLKDNDYFYNQTRSNNPPNRIGESTRRRIKNSNTNSFFCNTVSSQAAGDTIIYYKFTDKTSYLQESSLSIQKDTEGDDSASFQMYSTYEQPGSVMLFDGSDSAGLANVCEEYNLSSQSWSSKSYSGAQQRNFPNYEADKTTRKAYGINGQAATTATTYSMTLEYSFAGDSWTNKTNNVNDASSGGSSALINSKIYHCGGDKSNGNVSSDTGEYNYLTDTWSSKSSFFSPGISRATGSNVANIFLLQYGWNGSTAYLFDSFYFPDLDYWRGYGEFHNISRYYSGSIVYDNFNVSTVGGSSDGTAANAKNTQLGLSFMTKTYYNRGTLYDSVTNAYITKYGEYGFLAGGENIGGLESTSRLINPTAESVAIGVTNLTTPVIKGKAVEI